jgi:hypothetical protein
MEVDAMKTRHGSQIILSRRTRGCLHRLAVSSPQHSAVFRLSFKTPRPAESLAVRWHPAMGWYVPVKVILSQSEAAK